METKDKKKSKWKITAGVILIIQLLLSMATVGVVLWLNIVPTLYVILLGLILLLLLPTSEFVWKLLVAKN